ncbi:hypothetical protein ABZ330_05840 [Streptomyces sp. NPDC006172]|uniref:hypothetical protein n=1 Tax=Streptomyces sp. NPDC006172 TaxID=3154470 RepID=UPI0033C36EF6
MTMRRDVHDELRARLRGAPGSHEPNRERILARIERGMAGEQRTAHRDIRPPLWSWTRIVGATAAVAGMLAVGGYAVASAVRGDSPPQQQTVAVSSPPVPSPKATSRPPASPKPTPTHGREKREPAEPSASPSHSAPSTPSAPAAPPVTTAPPPSHGVEDGPLWSDGSVDPHSNDFWAQSNVTLKTSEQLTSLTVRLKVAQTGGVSPAGAWRSLAEGDFTFTLAERDGYLVYTWVLKEGRTVPKGEWVFAGQYNHERGGRDAKDDSFAVTGRAGSADRSVGGGFAAEDDG